MISDEEIAALFDVPVEALAGARRAGCMKRLHRLLWWAYIGKVSDRWAAAAGVHPEVVKRILAGPENYSVNGTVRDQPDPGKG